MGILGRLFGARRPRKPPAWARDFGDDGEAFAAFTAVVGDVLAAEGFPLDGDSLRSGSLVLETDGGGTREWIVHELAARCAATPRARWFELVRRDFRGEAAETAADRTRAWREQRARAAGARSDAPDRAEGVGPWRGGVVLDDGDGRSVLIALPVTRAGDASTIAAPAGAIAAVIVCNAGDDGHLAGAALARASGVDHVLAIDATRPVDRPAGDGPGVAVRALGRARLGALTCEALRGCVRIAFPGGKVGLVGAPIPLSLIAEVRPAITIGLIDVDDPQADLVDWMLAPGDVVLMANAVGLDATRTAQMLAQLGVGSRVMNLDAREAEAGNAGAPAAADARATDAGATDAGAGGAPDDAAAARARIDALIAASPELTPEQRAIATLIAGDPDTAAQLAQRALAEPAHAARAHYTLAMIALMRGDEAAALDALARAGDDPEALHSRAQLLARRADPAARDLADRALAARPADPLIQVGAIRAHALTGDRAGARAHHAAHAAGLDRVMRAHADAALALAGDGAGAGADGGSPAAAAHQFPHLATTAQRLAAALIDAGDLAAAEPILRRAASWAPDDVAVAGELGYVLGKLGRDDDAIAHYDRAIARGGPMVLLRFNRANACLRRRRLDDAIADLQACIALDPTWLEPRVNLVTALHLAGNGRSARAALAELRARGGAPDQVRALTDMLDGRG